MYSSYLTYTLWISLLQSRLRDWSVALTQREDDDVMVIDEIASVRRSQELEAVVEVHSHAGIALPISRSLDDATPIRMVGSAHHSIALSVHIGRCKS